MRDINSLLSGLPMPSNLPMPMPNINGMFGNRLTDDQRGDFRDARQDWRAQRPAMGAPTLGGAGIGGSGSGAFQNWLAQRPRRSAFGTPPTPGTPQPNPGQQTNPGQQAQPYMPPQLPGNPLGGVGSSYGVLGMHNALNGYGLPTY